MPSSALPTAAGCRVAAATATPLDCVWSEWRQRRGTARRGVCHSGLTSSRVCLPSFT